MDCLHKTWILLFTFSTQHKNVHLCGQGHIRLSPTWDSNLIIFNSFLKKGISQVFLKGQNLHSKTTKEQGLSIFCMHSVKLKERMATWNTEKANRGLYPMHKREIQEKTSRYYPSKNKWKARYLQTWEQVEIWEATSGTQESQAAHKAKEHAKL